MTRPGLKTLKCSKCGKVIEVESGINSLYCCATKMEEPVEEKQPQ